MGNEPGWNLEIFDGRRILLVTDYGAARVEMPLPEPTVNLASRRSRWESGELFLDIVGRTCLDTMSGALFEDEVTVSWQGQILRGCGRSLH